MNVTIKPQKASISVKEASAGISVGNPVARDYLIDRDPFTGSYSVTPSGETQILETKNLRMTDNVTIEPIPNNYGLITWNGAFLTVS